MSTEISLLNMSLTKLYKLEDDLYHRYSVYCGLSDPASWILYSLCEDEEKVYTQNDFVSMWYYPKQTVNYAVSGLVKKGWITLEQRSTTGNSKSILLTETGKRICEEKLLPLMRAEERSLQRMTEEERKQLLALTEKQITFFEEEINKLTGEKASSQE